MEGQIVRSVSGIYSVLSGAETVLCRARGRFRRDSVTPMVGDRISFEIQPDGFGRIARVFPRRSVFVRPPVANADTLVLVAAGIIPRTDPYLVDKMAVAAELGGAGAGPGVSFVLCVNKVDKKGYESLCAAYELAGYPVFRVSALTGEGLPPLADYLSGKLAVFSGHSGVGKTSLLNALCPGLSLKTGEVSEKLGQGRHTTRHVEIYSGPGGIRVADTPGFSLFDTGKFSAPADLGALFPEFRPYLSECQFSECLHNGVKGCAVESALRRGNIARLRYDGYLRLLEESAARARNRYR